MFNLKILQSQCGRLGSIIILFFVICSYQAHSQGISEKELTTSIDKVTVFLQGAQVFRSGTIQIPQGKSTIIVKSLSPHIDDKSIQVKGSGRFTILSVNGRFNHLDEIKQTKTLDSLQAKIDKLEDQVGEKESRMDVLKEKKSLLDANKKLGGTEGTASLSELQEAMRFYDQELTNIREETRAITKDIKKLDEQIGKLESQVSEASSQQGLPSGEIEVRVEATRAEKAAFQITYLVGNAGWHPKYDLRVESIDQPVKLGYQAEVYQNTGIDWNNVKLTFSNANPNQSSVAPELSIWKLDYARLTRYQEANYGVPSSNVGSVSGTVVSIEDQEPLPGVNVLVKGTSIGTVTDLNGRYNLTLPANASRLVFSSVGFIQKEVVISSSVIHVMLEPDNAALQEVVVVGYGLSGKVAGVAIESDDQVVREAEIVRTTTVENQTSVSFEVDEPYTVKSNGKSLEVDIKTLEIPAEYQYYAVPKIDQDAFLLARITDWEKYNLLEGEANLYFEDAYIGRTILDARKLEDTLEISLGRDRNVLVTREKVNDFVRTRLIGGNKLESRGYRIIARNRKSQSITLIVKDQLPIPARNTINVNVLELSGADITARTGEVIWTLPLKPADQRALDFQYEVKYPKGEKVDLE